MPATGNLGVSYLCRHVRVVVMVSSDHVPRGWNKGGIRVHVLKGGSKSWIVHGLDAIAIKVIT